MEAAGVLRAGERHARADAEKTVELADAECDALNERAMHAVNAGGEAYLSHTRLGGRYVLRLAVGSERTTDDDVRRAWDAIRRP